MQYLEEDPRTNRIDDSLQLFTAICSNKLLKNTHLVLMLNKVFARLQSCFNYYANHSFSIYRQIC